MTVRHVRNVTIRTPDSVTSAYGVSIDTVRSDAIPSVTDAHWSAAHEHCGVGKVRSSNYPPKIMPLVHGQTNDKTERNLATMLTSPEEAAYRELKATQPQRLADELDVPRLRATRPDRAGAVKQSDLSRAVAMLINQADAALDGMGRTCELR
jgi:hypothetical protein